MRYTIQLILSSCLFLVCCNNGGNGNDSSGKGNLSNVPTSAGENEGQQGAAIVGEWEQVYTCFDKNGNYKLEPEEKKPSGTNLGFNWFRFDANGNCLRDKDVKFKGTYEIVQKGNERKLVIEGGDNLRYTIVDLTDKELILGASGAFIVFKRLR